ncbi:MAG: hypothetical protein BJ554DRAFT_7877 [Olpidium bornovanus]|uniref:Uncharacterized protein n=1 Tax=Olpidium bornovanus TaxID=278681 RepID=A0A8H8DJH5_9FUNG|nr:MAG: hypothetical protein BJ554DRAFT_7877 [Olpidium bornovanus]
MAPRVLVAAAFALAALAAVAAAARGRPPASSSSASQSTVLVVLGEDWSDVRNTHLLTGQAVAPSPPYSEGRFSNGPLWAEVAAVNAGLDLNCGAYAGSTTSNDAVRASPFFGVKVNRPDGLHLPDLYEQALKAFAENNQKNVLAVFAGANDFLYDPETSAQSSASRVVDAVSLIPQFRAGKLPTLFFELPPLDAFPAVAGDANAPLREKLKVWTREFNLQLYAGVAAIRKEPGSSPVDIFPTRDFFYETASVFEVQDEPCVNEHMETNGSPHAYLFWDGSHFSADFHHLLGTRAAAYLQDLLTIKN